MTNQVARQLLPNLLFIDMSFAFWISLYAALAGAIATACMIWPYRKLAGRIGLIAVPNARSAHVIPTPSGAGLWIVVTAFTMHAFLVYESILLLDVFLLLWPGALLTALVGFIDDRKPLPSSWRALTHLVAAALFAFALYKTPPTDISLPIYIYPLVILAVAWSLNLFNFMDGTDGLAAVEAIFVLGVGGLCCWWAGVTGLAVIAFILVGPCVGFLAWNWPKAKVFMGDVGSGFLGFIIGAFAMLTILADIVPLLVWLILYGSFWFDTGVTLVRRSLRGEKWYVAHKTHAYQRLLHGAGYTHRRLLLWSIALNTALAALAIWGFSDRTMLPVAFVISIILLTGIYLRIEHRYPMTSVKI